MFEELKELLERNPFEPFEIITGSGNTHHVPTSQNALLLRDRITIAPPARDHTVTIQLRQIAEIVHHLNTN